MLTFRNTNILFGLLMLLLVGYDFFYGLSVYWYVAMGVAYSLILFWGSYYVGSGFYLPVICAAKTDKMQIALSFDDGPVNEFTPQILQILKELNVSAAFFCIGKRAQENPELFKRVYDEGHLIGNHSFSHETWFDLFSARKMMNDLKMMDAVMENLIGKKPKLFRPPYGVTNPNLKKAIIRGKYIAVGWSIRSLDTTIVDEKKLLAKVIKALNPGAVILFHDTAKAIPEVLPAFIQYARSSGYEIVRLDKLLNLEAYA